jgi:hypothetical protein
VSASLNLCLEIWDGGPSSVALRRVDTPSLPTFISRRLEPEETAAVGGRQNYFVLQIREIENGWVRHVCPTGQIRALLQHEIR